MKTIAVNVLWKMGSVVAHNREVGKDTWYFGHVFREFTDYLLASWPQ